MIPVRTAAQLQRLFSGDELAEARRALPGRTDGQTDEHYERVLAAVVKLSEGNLVRLRYFADRARRRPQDVVLLAAVLAVYGPLPGDLRRLAGVEAVTVTERGPYPVGMEEDLWERLAIAWVAGCPVCGEPLRKRRRFGRKKPVIYPLPTANVTLGRSGTETGQARYSSLCVQVHGQCAEAGAAMAAEQGYDWRPGW